MTPQEQELVNEPFDRLATLGEHKRQLISRLQVQPEFRRCTEIARKADRCISRHGARLLLAKDI